VGHETDYTISDFVADVRLLPICRRRIGCKDKRDVKNTLQFLEVRLGSEFFKSFRKADTPVPSQ
jgi:exonuclease VII large subunit